MRAQRSKIVALKTARADADQIKHASEIQSTAVRVHQILPANGRRATKRTDIHGYVRESRIGGSFILSCQMTRNWVLT